MLIWVNGPFGVGKSSVASQLVSVDGSLRLFDPEFVGYMLRANLSDIPNRDFQDLPPWRALVPRVAAEVAALTGQTLVTVQTVLSYPYWEELRRGLVREGLDPYLVVLDCAAEELRRRAETDGIEQGAKGWRIDHIEPYIAEKEWLIREADLVVDTTRLSVSEVSELVLAGVAHLKP